MSRSREAPYHHGDLKRALVEAALQIIEAEGHGAVTFRRLARKLKVSHAAPLAHFADRPSLDAAIATRCFSRLETQLLAMPAAVYEPRRDGLAARRLVAMSLAYIRFAIEHAGLYRAMYAPELTERLQSPDLPEPFRDLLREKDQVFKLFADLVKDGQGDGDFRRGVPPDQIARLFLGLAEGLARQYLEAKPDSTGDRMKDAEQLIELQLRAILREPDAAANRGR